MKSIICERKVSIANNISIKNALQKQCNKTTTTTYWSEQLKTCNFFPNLLVKNISIYAHLLQSFKRQRDKLLKTLQFCILNVLFDWGFNNYNSLVYDNRP